MPQQPGGVVLTPEEWRRIHEDHKCVEGGQRYVLRIEDGVARIVTVTLSERDTMAEGRSRPRRSRCGGKRG